MTRKDRMQLVQRITTERERHQAQKFATSRGKVAQGETKLAELQGYHDSYQRGLAERMARGISVTGMRDHQAFLAKLAEAVRQQTEVLMKARVESDTERRLWQGTAQRSKIIDKVVERREALDLRIEDAREQRDSDERGQRTARGST